ncbi:hypothetical protein PF010_g14971 [Phytophthora fragariae]|uniref:Amino acid transporter transmembrane domain-containing protein n=1 Tax=Phytophthora fragariae TaxID=53985 RepID=A0A6G0KVA9_9STRA|nr:hypothetical protein PF010_g14971 [Phytophthora fragariae]KAE9255686.1 hypothetical protein PF004_g495 [Phytophthora fragariae]
MSRVVGVTVDLISCLFLVLTSTAFSVLRCHSMGNWLFTIYPDKTTRLTTLGLAPNWFVDLLAYLFMQLHITIASTVIVNPAFYIAERHALSVQKGKPRDLEDPVSYMDAATPGVTHGEPRRSSKMPCVSVADARTNKKAASRMRWPSNIAESTPSSTSCCRSRSGSAGHRLLGPLRSVHESFFFFVDGAQTGT